MSNLLARLQQSRGGNNSSTGGGGGIFNSSGAASVRSQPQQSQQSQQPQQQRKFPPLSNTNNNNHNNNNNNNNKATASLLEQQNKIMERFLSTIDRFQQERNEIAASHKAELIERDLLTDQVTLRFMIELEEQKKILSQQKSNGNNSKEDTLQKQPSLLVDGTEKKSVKKDRRGRQKRRGSDNNDDNDENNSSSDFDSDDDSDNNHKRTNSTAKKSRSAKLKDDIDMQNQRILLSKIEALESKLSALSKRQPRQQRATATRATTRRRQHATNAIDAARNSEYDDDDEDYDDDDSDYNSEDENINKTRSNNHDNVGGTSNSTTAARTRTATSRKTAPRVSGKRRQRDDDEEDVDEDDVPFSQLNNNNNDNDDTKSVRSVQSRTSAVKRSVAVKKTTTTGGKYNNRSGATLIHAPIAKINVIGPAPSRNAGPVATTDTILTRTSENPFLHYLRYLKEHGTASVNREEGVRRVKKILTGRADAAGVSASDAARKAILQLFGRAQSCLPELSPSALVLNSADQDDGSNSPSSIQSVNETSKIFSQLVDVSEKCGYFGEVSSVCQTFANVTLADKAGNSYQQLHLLSCIGSFLSFGLSSKVNPTDASKMVRSILYDSLLAVFLGLRRHRTSKDTDALKAREWISFASSLLCSRDLGKNLNIFGVNFSDEKRDLVGLTIEVAAQYLYSIADPSASSSSSPSEDSFFNLDAHWTALRKQLDWPRRYPEIMDVCQRFFDFAMQTCEKLVGTDSDGNNNINNDTTTNQIVFTIIQALRLLFHVISMNTGVGECIEALFPEASCYANNNNNSSSQNQQQNNFDDDDDDDELGGYNNSVENQKQNEKQPEEVQEQELDELNVLTLTRACLAAFIITDFDFDITQDDDTQHIMSSPAKQLIRALRVVTSVPRPRVDSLLEFAQLVCINAALGQQHNNNNNNNNNKNVMNSKNLRMLLNECVGHARERQTGVQGQPAVKPFIGSELSVMVTRSLTEYLQMQ